MSQLLAKEAFFSALEAARTSQHGGAHPFSGAWAGGELGRAQLGEWAIQHFYYIDPVPQQFAHLYARLPDLDARQHLLENLLGEEMPQSPAKRHPDLLRKFARACGVSDERILAAEERGEILPTTRAMRAWVWELVTVRELAEACAGIMVALEGQLPTLYPKYVEQMRRMGFTDDDLEFFWVTSSMPMSVSSSRTAMQSRRSRRRVPSRRSAPRPRSATACWTAFTRGSSSATPPDRHGRPGSGRARDRCRGRDRASGRRGADA